MRRGALVVDEEDGRYLTSSIDDVTVILDTLVVYAL